MKGERSKYEPIDRYSRVVRSSDPQEVLDQLRPGKVYVADLNRLMGSGDNLEVLQAISLKVPTMADIGIDNLRDLSLLPERISPVLGTETASLEVMKAAASSRPVVVSIDMKGRRVLSRDPQVMSEPEEFLRQIHGLPLEAVILLELDRVGTSAGLDEEFLMEMVSISSHPLIMGGGIKGPSDLEILEHLGFEGALVATAIHNGSLPLQAVR